MPRTNKAGARGGVTARQQRRLNAFKGSGGTSGKSRSWFATQRSDSGSGCPQANCPNDIVLNGMCRSCAAEVKNSWRLKHQPRTRW